MPAGRHGAGPAARPVLEIDINGGVAPLDLLASTAPPSRSMLMRRVIVGAIGAALVGVLAFVVLLAVFPAAEGQSCWEQDAVKSWDMHYELESKETRLGKLLNTARIEFSADLKPANQSTYRVHHGHGEPQNVQTYKGWGVEIDKLRGGD